MGIHDLLLRCQSEIVSQIMRVDFVIVNRECKGAYVCHEVINVPFVQRSEITS